MIPAGLPNITAEAQFSQEWQVFGVYPYTGAFYLKRRNPDGVDGKHGSFDIVGFDAARYSSVYGAVDQQTVRPNSICIRVYIRCK